MNSKYKRKIAVFILFIAFFVLANKMVFAQNLIIRGTVLCKPEGQPTSERPVDKECIIVIPSVAPDSATISSDDGVFDINLPFANEFINRSIIIKCYNQYNLVGHSKIFLASEALRNENRNKVFKIRQPITLNKECDSLNSDIISCQTELNTLKSRRIDTTKVSKNYYYKTSPILSGAVIAIVAALAGAVKQFNIIEPDSTVTDTLSINSIILPKVDLVDFYLSLFNINSLYRGMNYAPAQDFEVSPFLNPSSIVFSNFRNVSISSDFTRYVQVSGSFAISNKFGVGTGLLFLSQNEDIIATLFNEEIHNENRLSNIKVALASAAYKIDEHFSFGFSAKSVQQKVEQPIDILKTRAFREGKIISTSQTFRTNKIRVSYFDFDVSLTFKPSSPVRFGVTIFNVLNKKLVSQIGKPISVKSLGWGVSLKKRHISIGLDSFAAKGFRPHTTVGLNYIVNNWFDINSSITNLLDSFQLGISLKDPIARIRYTFSYSELFEATHLVGLSISF